MSSPYVADSVGARSRSARICAHRTDHSFSTRRAENGTLGTTCFFGTATCTSRPPEKSITCGRSADWPPKRCAPSGEIIRPGHHDRRHQHLRPRGHLAQGARPAPLNYHGFPKSVCTSINEVVCHGIPGASDARGRRHHQRRRHHLYHGFHGDTSATFYVGTPSEDAKKVTEIARRSLELGIAEVKPGARLGDIGAAIQEFAEGQGCGVVTDFVGHGIGRQVSRGAAGQPRGSAGPRRAPARRHDVHDRADDQPRQP